MALHGKVVVVPVGDGAHTEAVARRLAAEGATVVLVAAPAAGSGADGGSGDAAAAGVLAADLEGSGSGRPAVFAAAPGDLDALVEFLAELFR